MKAEGLKVFFSPKIVDPQTMSANTINTKKKKRTKKWQIPL